MTEPEAVAPPLDARAAQRWQLITHRQALQSGAPWLHQEVGERMAQRLGWIKRQPKSWVNWRPWSSGPKVHAQVCAQYPDSEAYLAPALMESVQNAQKLIASQGFIQQWIGRLKGQASRMLKPVQDGGAHMVWSNMSLHAEPDPSGTVAVWHRMLATDGYLMFSCLGPDTVLELRHAFRSRGWGPPAHPLTDMHDWGDLLVSTGFAEPVMDMERITLSFATPERALQELRGLGRNLHPLRFQGLRGRDWHNELLQSLEALRQPHGSIELTFEVIYGHAFKPAPRLKVSAESAISLRDMRVMLGQPKRR